MDGWRWIESDLTELWRRWCGRLEVVVGKPCGEGCYSLDDRTEVPVGEVVTGPGKRGAGQAT